MVITIHVHNTDNTYRTNANNNANNNKQQPTDSNSINNANILE